MAQSPSDEAASQALGFHALREPLTNKGIAYSEDERHQRSIAGLLPAAVQDDDLQVTRELSLLRNKSTPLEKYLHLTELQDHREDLFFRLLINHTQEIMPIVYTPTVGEACVQFSNIYRRPRGMFITAEHRGRVAEVLRNWPRDDVEVVVFTDGERILGLGDLGANGMGIPIGKLNLYVACAGIDPSKVLPVTLDVGCNVEAVREDPLYIGLRQPRLRGNEYYALVDEFMEAAQIRFGRTLLLQFEDFGNSTAFHLLERWRDRACCFNDDIQGTASVALAGVIASTRLTGIPLAEQTFLFMGAGEAGTGIANLIAYAVAHEGSVDVAEARKRIHLVDSKGLVTASRFDSLQHHKRDFAHDSPEMKALVDIVKTIKPSVLIGVCAVPSTFDEAVLRACAEVNEHPVVFALSNPTSKAECTAAEAYQFTGGKAIFASGSPFDPVEVDGAFRHPGQGNNAYIFPGVGLGAMACGATHLDEHTFYVAARALADQVSEASLADGCLYPPLDQIREVSAHVAAAVAEHCYSCGCATVTPQPDDLLAFCKARMYKPHTQGRASL